MIDRSSPVTVVEAPAPLTKDADDAFSTPLFTPVPGKPRASRRGAILGDRINHVGFHDVAVSSRRASVRTEAPRIKLDSAQAPLTHPLPTWRIEGLPLPEYLTMLASQMHDKLEEARPSIISPRYHPEFDDARRDAQALLTKLINALRAAAIAQETSAGAGTTRIEREYEKLCEALVDKLERERSVARMSLHAGLSSGLQSGFKSNSPSGLQSDLQAGPQPGSQLGLPSSNAKLPPGAAQLLECIEYVMSPLQDKSVKGRSRASDVPRYFKALERHAKERRGLSESASAENESSENTSPAKTERDKRASVAQSEASDRGRWLTAERLRGWLRRRPSTNK